MRYFTSDTHFGHPLVTALRGFLNNGRLRAEYHDIWQAQGRTAAHAWIKQYVQGNQTSFKAICDIERHEDAIIGNINGIVGRDDELWILGDLSYRCTVEHTLDCLRRIDCRHLHMIIGNHDRNFRLRSNDVLYAGVFETIDDYREIDMEMPLFGESGEPTGQTAPQTVGMSHFPRLSSMLQKHDDWPGNWNEFADDAPGCEGWLLYGHTHQDVPDGTDPRCVNVGLDAWDLKPVSEQRILEWFMGSLRRNPTADGSGPCIPARW